MSEPENDRYTFPDATEPPSPLTEPSSSLLPAIAAGLVAALVGGIVWGLIVKISDYEVGFVAWGIGFLAGSAVVFATRGAKGRPLQVIAVVSALLGILLGKYLSFAFSVQEDADAAGVSIGLLSSDMFTLFRENLGRRLQPLRPALGRLRGLQRLADPSRRLRPRHSRGQLDRQVARPFLTRLLVVLLAGQNVVAGRSQWRSAWRRRLRMRLRLRIPVGRVVKIAERYCVPTSQPGGYLSRSWRLQNLSTSSPYEISLGSKSPRPLGMARAAAADVLVVGFSVSADVADPAIPRACSGTRPRRPRSSRPRRSRSL